MGIETLKGVQVAVSGMRCIDLNKNTLKILGAYFSYYENLKIIYKTVPRKFFIRKNNNKVNSIETERIVIANLLPWSGLKKCMYVTLYQLMMIKIYCYYLIYKYNFTCSLFWTTRKLTNYIKII